jgi:molybdopterin-containing oxidoreductase family membrane subunit
MFIVMSLDFGLAIFLLVLLAAARGTGRAIGGEILERLRVLLAVFAAAVLYFAAIQQLTNAYVARQHDVVRFFLVDGGVYTALFWIGQVAVGGVAPLALLLAPALRKSRRALALASACVVAGGLAQMYVLIIGGQAYPQMVFPDHEVSSSAFDGVVASYAPSLPEVMLGLGGVALALMLTVVALRLLPFLPQAIADPGSDPAPA